MAAYTELPERPRSSPFASLQHQQFRWLYASNILFFLAMNGQFIVRSILAYDLTGSKVALGMINLVVAIPMLIVSPFGGVLADRMEKRRLIIGGQAILVTNELVILILLLTGLLEFWHLLAVVFLMGCVFPFIMPARQAIVVNIVGRQGLGNAMALQMGGMNAARIVGPVLAGALAAAAGVKWVYVIAVCMYGVALLAMSRVNQSPPIEGASDRSVISELKGGFTYVAKDPPVRALMILGIIPMLLAMPFQGLLVVFTEDVWKVGDGGLGILHAAAGTGGIVGSIFVAWRSESPRRLKIMMSSMFAFAGTLFLFALSPWFLLALPLVLIADIFASVFTTMNNTVVQLLIPDAVRGRVMALMMMTFGLTPLGTLPVSVVAEAFGAPFAVASASVVTVLLSLLIFILSKSIRDLDRISEEALERDLASGDGTRAPFPGMPSPAPTVVPTEPPRPTPTAST